MVYLRGNLYSWKNVLIFNLDEGTFNVFLLSILLSENIYSRGTFNFVLEILRVRKLKSLDLRITNHISLISRLFKASTTFLFVCFLLRQIMLFCLQTVTL